MSSRIPKKLTVNTPQWDKFNQMRIALIDKKYTAGLDAAEEAQLSRLQDVCEESLARAYPPVLLSDDELAIVKKAIGIE